MSRTLLLALLLCSWCWSQSLSDRVKIEVSVLTHFAHDRGSIPDSVWFQGKQYSLAEAAGAILPQLGWGEPANRPELAVAWVNEVNLVGLRSLGPPKVQTLPDGKTQVEAWVDLPTGNHPAATGHYRYIFTPAGVQQTEVLEVLSTPMRPSN